MTYAELEPASLMNQISRTRQLKLVFLLIKQQQTLHFRYRCAQNSSELRRWLRKSLERNVQRNFLVRRVRERFNLKDSDGQCARPRHFLQFSKRLRQPRRKHRTLVDRHNKRTLRQKISQRPRHSALHRPLRAIPVSVRLRGVLLNGAVPGNPAQPGKRLAQNVFLQPHLLADGNVLVVAATACLEMWTRSRSPLLGRRRHLQQLGPDHFFFPST